MENIKISINLTNNNNLHQTEILSVDLKVVAIALGVIGIATGSLALAGGYLGAIYGWSILAGGICAVAAVILTDKKIQKEIYPEMLSSLSLNHFNKEEIGEIGPQEDFASEVHSFLQKIEKLADTHTIRGLSFEKIASGIKQKVKSPEDARLMISHLDSLQARAFEIKEIAKKNLPILDELQRNAAVSRNNGYTFEAITSLYAQTRDLVEKEDLSNIHTAIKLWIEELRAYQLGKLRRSTNQPTYSLQL